MKLYKRLVLISESLVVTAVGQDMSYLEEGYRAAGGLDKSGHRHVL